MGEGKRQRPVRDSSRRRDLLAPLARNQRRIRMPLHYWLVPGGIIELGRVELHDDIEP